MYLYIYVSVYLFYYLTWTGDILILSAFEMFRFHLFTDPADTYVSAACTAGTTVCTDTDASCTADANGVDKCLCGAGLVVTLSDYTCGMPELKFIQSNVLGVARARVCVCVRACVRVCVRACVRACV